ncbi:MAG: peptidoglycan bridge formation glycyltransferase FemA/FemB family protein, partial [Actinomycetes bacterium]
MPLDVRTISPQEHLAYIARQPSVSFLQTPSWGGVKAEWGSQSLGWFEDGELVGAGLVLTRKVPKLDRWLAYLPEGPALDWERAGDSAETVREWLDPMLAMLKASGAFQVKLGPTVPVRTWHANTLKDAIAAASAKRLRGVPPDETFERGERLASALADAGWTQRPDTGAGFGDVQPRYVFQIPLAGRTEDDVFAGFNQLWRRNVRKADKLGVTVEQAGKDGLKQFHPIYVETAARDGFVPRGLKYFQRMWDAMSAEDPERLRLYLASYQGTVLAATTMVTVGDHAWYSYGASADVGREVR